MFSDILDCEQQRVAVPFNPHFLMARIRILRRDCASSQRALRRLTCRNMRQRPTSVLLRFMSTTLSQKSRHYKPNPAQTSAFAAFLFAR
jgi:DNA-binding response OmpR family regulator